MDTAGCPWAAGASKQAVAHLLTAANTCWHELDPTCSGPASAAGDIVTMGPFPAFVPVIPV